jgi:hypothetical protein
LSIFVTDHDLVSGGGGQVSANRSTADNLAKVIRPSSAQNLHNNPHILIIPHINPANRAAMLGAWRKSSLSVSDDRDCLGGC